MRRLTLAMMLVLASVLCPTTARAQGPCSFVLGFAELAARLGPETVGACLENQRTTTSDERFVLSDRITLSLFDGATVQRTITGVFVWFPQPNITEFNDANGTWRLAAAGVTFSRWEGITAESASPPAPATSSAARAPGPPTAAAPAVDTDRRDADSRCFRIYSNELISALDFTGTAAGRRDAERREAQANAMNYLCAQAAEQHGLRGVACFESAWGDAAGMEQIFAGSGRQTYEESYRACIKRP